MVEKKTKQSIDGREYMNLRKVLADRDHYLNPDAGSAELEDLMVLLSLAANPSEDYAGKRQAAIAALYRERRKTALEEIAAYQEAGKTLTRTTVDTLKTYADLCFYHARPELFSVLCRAVRDADAPVRFGPLEIPGSDSFPDTFDSTYRMLFYDKKTKQREGKGIVNFWPGRYYAIQDAYTSHFAKGVPTDFYDAFASYQFFEEQYLTQRAEAGEAVETHENTDGRRLEYYASEAFEADRIAQDPSNGLKIEESAEAPELARDMSRYSYYREKDPETAHRNIVRRAFFDAIAKAGELPQEVTAEDARTYSMRECLDIIGAAEFLNTADAAFFMHGDPREYNAFLLVQKLYDASAQQKQ